MALTKITGQVVDTTTDLVVGVTTVGGGLSAVDGFFSGILTATGAASFSGNVSVGGTLTYEDVTNIDAVGIITARSNILVGSGITLSPDGDIFFTGIMTGNGSGLTGVANTDVIFTDKLSLGDNGRINLGIGSDLQIYHDSSMNANRFESGGTTVLFRSNLIEFGDNSGNKYIKCVDGAQVELYHGVNSKKLETSSGGGVLTGTWLPASDASGNFGSTIYDMIGSKELSGALTTIRISSSYDDSEVFDGGYYKVIEYTGTV